MTFDPSQGKQASGPATGNLLRDSIASFVRYLELRLQLIGLESREAGLHLLVLALLLVSTVICFACFVAMLIVFLLYLLMLTFALGVGLERPGTCGRASCSQYWSRADLQIEDREAVFPCHFRRVSKGS